MEPVVRDARADDATWIIRLLTEGAEQGHFAKTVAWQAPALVSEILTKGQILWTKIRGGMQSPSHISARIRVAEIDNEPASFMIVLTNDDEIELHLTATKKKHRRKGCFRALVRDEIAMWTGREKLFARCYKKSTWAKDGLLSEGFTVSDLVEPVEFTLCQDARR
jgi:hypothetical protein